MVASMVKRSFILSTLAVLEVWLWPVFFWELTWFKLYVENRIAREEWGFLRIGIAKDGRLYIIRDVRADTPEENWTRFAPRAPWEKLTPGAALAVLPMAALRLRVPLTGPIATARPASTPFACAALLQAGTA